MRNLCGIGWKVYQLLQRTVVCARCGADAGEKCIGRSGKRIETTHLARKHLIADWRREYPARWRLLREAVAISLVEDPQHRGDRLLDLSLLLEKIRIPS